MATAAAGHGRKEKCTAGAAAFLPVTPQLETSGWCSANLSALLPIAAVSMCSERASSNYSMTSSARASSAGGMVIPSAFAVLRLIIS